MKNKLGWFFTCIVIVDFDLLFSPDSKENVKYVELNSFVVCGTVLMYCHVNHQERLSTDET
jgi:hypothetical protein